MLKAFGKTEACQIGDSGLRFLVGDESGTEKKDRGWRTEREMGARECIFLPHFLCVKD